MMHGSGAIVVHEKPICALAEGVLSHSGSLEGSVLLLHNFLHVLLAGYNQPIQYIGHHVCTVHNSPCIYRFTVHDSQWLPPTFGSSYLWCFLWENIGQVPFILLWDYHSPVPILHVQLGEQYWSKGIKCCGEGISQSWEDIAQFRH